MGFEHNFGLVSESATIRGRCHANFEDGTVCSALGRCHTKTSCQRSRVDLSETRMIAQRSLAVSWYEGFKHPATDRRRRVRMFLPQFAASCYWNKSCMPAIAPQTIGNHPRSHEMHPFARSDRRRLNRHIYFPDLHNFSCMHVLWRLTYSGACLPNESSYCKQDVDGFPC